MEIRKYVLAAIGATACAAMGAYLYSNFEVKNITATSANDNAIQTEIRTIANYAPTDFTEAAESTINGVVHVKILQDSPRQSQYGSSDPLWQFFFGPQYQYQQQPQQPRVTGSGSGVIISENGYIVTNNHVIESADKIEVVLNDRRSFEATLIGTDPTTDIALIKIEATGLHALKFGNSDAMKVGEWVLAVGNPFNLTSTVTAGIISAKARNMGINNNNMAIESFIQTDAAVNPGNSGGALVNTHGEVIGINTAIASQTGSYTGYSFAVPSNIAQKVAQDLMQYGEVQRALLGVQIREMTEELQKETKLDNLDGVYVGGVADGGAAKEAGIETGDVILKINGEKVATVPEVQEKVGMHRPGDNINLKIWRNGKEQDVTVTLRNIRGTTSIINVNDKNQMLGAKLEKVDNDELDKLGLRYGIKVTDLSDGKMKDCGIREGFIITKANRQPVTSPDDFNKIVLNASEGLFIAGVYPNGKIAYYAINLEN
ncbi:MAG: Do family serine endopeptidase [Marinilabiliaceae bacterium]|nr:Do family serine endopeptidase [Marinilabiliaceae bacterium]